MIMNKYMNAHKSASLMEDRIKQCKNVYYWLNQILIDDKLDMSESNTLIKAFASIL